MDPFLSWDWTETKLYSERLAVRMLYIFVMYRPGAADASACLTGFPRNRNKPSEKSFREEPWEKNPKIPLETAKNLRAPQKNGADDRD